jgi:hypothetical protein
MPKEKWLALAKHFLLLFHYLQDMENVKHSTYVTPKVDRPMPGVDMRGGKINGTDGKVATFRCL